MQDYLNLGSQDEQIAEVWFGTHPGGESKVRNEATKLSSVISGKLSFLTKFLAADKPLSIQVHPNLLQAKQGFDRENGEGLDLADPRRNYRDELHKPEILIALTPFWALCGFRPIAELMEIFLGLSAIAPRLGELAMELKDEASLKEVFAELLASESLATKLSNATNQLVPSLDDSLAVTKAKQLLLELTASFPNDTGVLVALMLNLVELDPGQAIFLPAGNVHAYLSGLGLEVMAASDNVIRGGLTVKHVDRQQLLEIADFRELTNPLVETVKLAEGLTEYEVPATEFRVYRADVSTGNLLMDIDLPGGAMVICVSGSMALSTSLDEREVLQRADVAYISQAKKFSLSGSGSAFVVLGS